MVEITREHMDLVYHVRHAYFALVPFNQIEDLESAGMLGLVKAARNYDPAKGASFRTHAWRRVHGQMQDHLRAQSGSRSSTGIKPDKHPIPVGEALMDYLADGDHNCDPIGDYELNNSLQSAIDTLPERDQAVLRLHYLQGLTLAEVGEFFEVTESRICQIASRACAQLAKVLDREALAA